jgi:alpha-L-fucosidase
MKTFKILFAALLFLLVLNTNAQTYEPNWASLDQRKAPGWFTDAKFGIFIHWGVYSVPAYRPVGKERYSSYAEWYQVDEMNEPGPGRDFHDRVYGKDFQYRQFAPLFRAELFNPDEWAGIFQNSGAKYVVLTAKHHDGFCLWPTKNEYSKNWNTGETGPKRDLVGDLTTAVRKKGLKMGLYYSIMEWETPPPSMVEKPYLPKEIIQKYQIPADKYVDDHLIPQLKELVTQYQPSVIFADGAGHEISDYWKSQSFIAWLYNTSPNKDEVLVNDRWGKDAHGTHGDFFSTEYSPADEKMSNSHLWEESQGVGGSYGYNRAENLEDYKSSAQIVYLLIDKVSKGGNLLLNVGPSADGLIPVIMQQRLADVGRWLKVNGDAIYGTRAWANRPADTQTQTAFYTTKGNDLYVIVTQWPEKELIIPGLKSSAKVLLLGSSAPVKSKSQGGNLLITPPAINPGNNPSEYAWVFKVEQGLIKK